MSICKIGSNTKETVIENFQSNVLISESPLTDGDYLVLKPQEFDQANSELSTDLFQSYNLFGTFWVRTNNRARFNTVLSDLTDILAKRQVSGNEQYTNNYKPPISPKTLQVEELSSTTIQQVKQYAKDIATGVRVLERFSQAEQRGIAAGGPNHAAASVLLATKAGSGKKAPATNEEQEALVEQFAKKEGIWVENVNATYGSAVMEEVDKVELLVASLDKRLPRIGNTVSGMMVGSRVDNMGSIEANFNDYETLDGIREVPMSEFPDMVGEQPVFYDTATERRTRELADAIDDSGTITPLIVVYDSDGPYILEGAHRFDALMILGKSSFPAKIVIDTENIEKAEGEHIATPGLPTIEIPDGYKNPCT